MSSYYYEFKILLLGDESVEKVAFTKRYCYDIFNPSERLTIGVDFHVKTVEVRGKKIKLKIWDVGGEERFRFLLPTYCLGANGVFILYDITNPQTLGHIGDWTNIVRQKSGNIPIMLVGTNLDLAETQRQITREYGLQVAEKNELASFSEISAKTGQNVNKTFEVMTQLILKRTESKFTSCSEKEGKEIKKQSFKIKKKFIKTLKKPKVKKEKIKSEDLVSKSKGNLKSDEQRVSQEFEKKKDKKLEIVMPVLRTLKEDFLDSPEKFGVLINFYGVLLRKLKEEATGIEILHHIATLNPDLYKMMRVEESPKISPSMAKSIIETLKRRALKVGTKPLNIFANEKKTHYKEIIEFLERLYKYAIKTRRECKKEFFRSKIRSLKRLKESKKIEERRKEEEEKVEYGKKLEQKKRGFEDLLKQELKKHLNDKENEEIKSTIETYIRWLVFKKILQIGVYPPHLHQFEKRIRNDFLIPDSIPIFFKEEIKQKTERTYYDILFVEGYGYPDTIRLPMAYFESKGYSCKGVIGGKKGFEELNNNIPKVILLDIIIPDYSGYELCKRIRSNPKWKDIPVFFFTTLPGSEVERHMEETGANGIIFKSFKFSDFDRILELLGSKPVKDQSI